MGRCKAHTFFVHRTLAGELMVAAVEKRKWLAHGIERQKVKLVEAGFAHGAFSTLLKQLWSGRVQDHLFLAAPVAIQTSSRADITSNFLRRAAIIFLCSFSALDWLDLAFFLSSSAMTTIA